MGASFAFCGHLFALLILLLLTNQALGLTKEEIAVVRAFTDDWTFLNSSSPYNWTAAPSNACSKRFFGITCSPEGHITHLEISLRGNFNVWLPYNIGGLKWLQTLIIESTDKVQLVGKLPESMTNLTDLKILKLDSADMEGRMLPDWISVLSNLTVLSMKESELVGTLPEGLWYLDKLTTLDLRGNYFVSSIPSSISRLSELVSLNIGNRGIHGTIPAEIGQLSKLEHLYIENSNFQGSIPDTLHQLSNLRSFELFDAGTLEGEAIFQAPNLTRLVLVNLKLNGTIPDSWYTHLPRLETLDLHANFFGGQISEMISTWKHLKILNLKDNGPSAEPMHFMSDPSVCDLANLAELILSNTQLLGLPDCLQRTKSLKRLEARNCGLNGTLTSLPSSIDVVDLQLNGFSGDLDNFLPEDAKPRVLQIGSNRLTGTIPSHWSKPLTYVRQLSLSNNNLTGTFPAFGVHNDDGLDEENFSTRYCGGAEENYIIEAMDVSNNDFSGPLPERIHQCANFSIINFSRNRFSGPIPASWSRFMNKIQRLDLSFNGGLNGTIPTNLWATARLRGEGRQSTIQSLHLQHNAFEFNISAIKQTYSLTSFLANENRIFGFPPLSSFPQLVELDLDKNNLNETMHWPTIERAFSSQMGRLNSLSIAGNPLIPTFPSFPDNSSIVVVKDQVPIFMYQRVKVDWHTICQRVVIRKSDSTGYHSLSVLDVDPELFNFRQCQCAHGYYGSNCFCVPCPLNGKCDDEKSSLLVSSSHYFYRNPAFVYNGTATSCEDMPREALVGPNSTHIAPILLERCRTQNCQGLEVNLNASWNVPVSEQCVNGSEGRFCSRCKCDLSDQSAPCFVFVRTRCTECSHRWKLNEALLVFIPITLAIICLLSTLMYYVLLKCREPDQDDDDQYEKPWSKVHIIKRIRIRFFLAVTSLFTLIQMIYEFVQVMTQLFTLSGIIDSSPIRGVSDLSSSSLLACIFPEWLLPPVPAFLMDVLTPVLFFAIFGISILVAEGLTKISRCYADTFSSVTTHSRTKDSNLQQASSSENQIELATDDDSYEGMTDDMETSHFLDSRLSMALAPKSRDSFQHIDEEDDESDEEKIMALEDDDIEPDVVEDELDQYPDEALRSLRLSEQDSTLFTSSDVPSFEGDATLNEEKRDTKVKNAEIFAPRYYPFTALLTNTLFHIFSFFYFDSSLATSRYLFPEEQPGTNWKFVVSVPHLRYDSPVANKLRLISIPFVFLIVGGYPAVYLLFGWMYGRRKSESLDMHVGAFFSVFKKNRTWYGGFVLSRRVILAIILAAIPSTSSWHAGTISFFLSFYLLATLALRPWQLRIQNTAEALMLATQLVNVATVEVGNQSLRYVIYIASGLSSLLLCFLVLGYPAFHGFTAETHYQKRWKELHPNEDAEMQQTLRLTKGSDSSGDAGSSKSSWRQLQDDYVPKSTSSS